MESRKNCKSKPDLVFLCKNIKKLLSRHFSNQEIFYRKLYLSMHNGPDSTATKASATLHLKWIKMVIRLSSSDFFFLNTYAKK